MATDGTDGAIPAATVQVSTTAQTPTSIKVTMPQSLPANTQGTTAQAYATIVDQSGTPMLSGSYGLTATVSGPASLDATGDKTITSAYVGNGTSTNAGATFTLYNIQGSEGTITLTYGVEVTDSHGYPVPYSGTLVVEVTKNGSIANNISVDGYYQSTNGAPDPVAATNGSFTVQDSQHGANAGTYTILVTDPTGALASSTPVTFSETPGPVAQLSVSAPSQVAVNSPSATITATLEDSFGNTVPTSGVIVNFSNDPANPRPGVTLATASATTVNGVATDVATAPTYNGNTYKVDVSSSGTATYNAQFSVEAVIASNLQVAMKDVAQGGNSSGTYLNSTTTAQASDTVAITVTAENPNGVTVDQQDTIQLAFSTTGLVPQYSTGGMLASTGTHTWRDILSANGTDTIYFTAETAGVVAVTVSDLSVNSVSPTSSEFDVVAGKAWGYGVFNASGTNLGTSGLTVAANTNEPVFVSALDEHGNRTVTTTDVTVYLGDGNRGGTYRLSPSGSAITSIVLAPGVTQYPDYYTNATAGTYDLTANP